MEVLIYLYILCCKEKSAPPMKSLNSIIIGLFDTQDCTLMNAGLCAQNNYLKLMNVEG